MWSSSGSFDLFGVQFEEITCKPGETGFKSTHRLKKPQLVTSNNGRIIVTIWKDETKRPGLEPSNNRKRRLINDITDSDTASVFKYLLFQKPFRGVKDNRRAWASWKIIRINSAKPFCVPHRRRIDWDFTYSGANIHQCRQHVYSIAMITRPKMKFYHKWLKKGYIWKKAILRKSRRYCSYKAKGVNYGTYHWNWPGYHQQCRCLFGNRRRPITDHGRFG